MEARSQFPEHEMKLYLQALTPVDPDKVAVEEVNHREYLRQVGTSSSSKIISL